MPVADQEAIAKAIAAALAANAASGSSGTFSGSESGTGSTGGSLGGFSAGSQSPTDEYWNSPLGKAVDAADTYGHYSDYGIDTGPNTGSAGTSFAAKGAAAAAGAGGSYEGLSDEEKFRAAWAASNPGSNYESLSEPEKAAARASAGSFSGGSGSSGSSGGSGGSGGGGGGAASDPTAELEALLMKLRDDRLAGVDAEFGPMFEELKRKREASSGEIETSGTEQRSALDQIRSSFEEQITALEKTLADRSGTIDADSDAMFEQLVGGAATQLEQATQQADREYLNQISANLGDRLNQLTNANFAGTEGTSRLIEQAGQSQLINAAASLRAQLDSQVAGQRAAIVDEFNQQLFQLKSSALGAASVSTGGGGGGGGGYSRRGSSGSSSSSSVGTSSEILARQFGMDPALVEALADNGLLDNHLASLGAFDDPYDRLRQEQDQYDRGYEQNEDAARQAAANALLNGVFPEGTSLETATAAVLGGYAPSSGGTTAAGSKIPFITAALAGSSTGSSGTRTGTNGRGSASRSRSGGSTSGRTLGAGAKKG